MADHSRKGYQRTRIAPTPSGFLHLGNIFSFAITAMLARTSRAKIMLRIDDLDRRRVNKAYLDDIFDTLRFLDISWDEGPADSLAFENGYSQLCRMDSYRAALDELAVRGCLYACVCSRKHLAAAGECRCLEKKLPLQTDNANWRFRTPESGFIPVKNYNGTVTQVELPAEMKNFVVRKKDGYPAYQLSSLIDDLTYHVDLIVRGQDLWPSTLAQLLLARALGQERFMQTAFYHHTLLAGPSGDKLSKSAGSVSVNYLRKTGLKPADIFMLTASMVGIGGAKNWQELAAAALIMNSAQAI